MNSGYKLDISKSSLLSLKAELARKHEEASKAKAQAQGNFIKPLGKPSKSTIFTRSNLGLEDRQQNDILELTEDEESKIRRSRSALEEKARIYDSLSQQTSHEKSSHYLVDFALKSADTSHLDQLEEKEDERKRLEREEEEEEARRADSDEYDVPSDPEDDWVDFTDSLGRTRRCLRRDLSRFRVLDDKLFRSLEAKKTQEDNERPDSIGPLPPGGLPAGCAAPDLLSDDMRREQQRLKWEEEEENLRSKGDIHYQDLLFDEARTHGVGYFPFARDEGVRRGQQEDLKKLRKETESKQKAALTQREKRDQLMRARLRAAHNRKRAREGLPPLGEDEELPSDKKDEPEEIEEPAPAAVPTVQKAKGPRPKPSPAIRPWDIGKEGCQAEWNEQQRKQRKQEFAPPSFYEDRQGEGRSERRDESGAERRPERRSKKRVEPRVDQDEAEDEVGPMPPPPRASPSPPGPAAPAAPPSNLGPAASAWFSVPPPSFMPPVHLPPPSMAPWPPQPVPPPAYPAPQPPPPGEEDDDDPRNRGGLFFSTKRPRHDWRAAQEEVRRPMEEEEVFTEPPPPGVSDSPPPPGVSDSPPPRAPARRKGGSEAGRVGAEIAPPPTLDYFGPSDSATERSRRSGQRGGQGSPGADDLSASISAGLQFLRKQAEDKERKRTDKGWADFV